MYCFALCCYSVLQCVAVYCTVLQCDVAVNQDIIHNFASMYIGFSESGKHHYYFTFINQYLSIHLYLCIYIYVYI